MKGGTPFQRGSRVTTSTFSSNHRHKRSAERGLQSAAMPEMGMRWRRLLPLLLRRGLGRGGQCVTWSTVEGGGKRHARTATNLIDNICCCISLALLAVHSMPTVQSGDYAGSRKNARRCFPGCAPSGKCRPGAAPSTRTPAPPGRRPIVAVAGPPAAGRGPLRPAPPPCR